VRPFHLGPYRAPELPKMPCRHWTIPLFMISYRRIAHEPDRAALIQIKHQARRLALANAEIIAQSKQRRSLSAPDTAPFERYEIMHASRPSYKTYGHPSRPSATRQRNELESIARSKTKRRLFAPAAMPVASRDQPDWDGRRQRARLKPLCRARHRITRTARLRAINGRILPLATISPRRKMAR
jgi:hypothetical protein